MSNSDPHNICRDYMNNICSRGDRCRYFHPPRDNDSSDSASRPEEFTFCEDYAADGYCPRPQCPYLHCATESAETYVRTGRMDIEMARAVWAHDPSRNDAGGRPLCKEHMNNACKRSNCKFWHVRPYYEQGKRYGGGLGQQKQHSLAVDMFEAPSKTNLVTTYPMDLGGSRVYNNSIQTGSEFESMDRDNTVKRPKYNQETGYYSTGSSSGGYYVVNNGQQTSRDPFGYDRLQIQRSCSPKMGQNVACPMPTSTSTSTTTRQALLRAEHSDLLRTYEMLQKTVDDLRASNESLLLENGRLREHWQQQVRL